MTSYAFYCCRNDGFAAHFEVREMDGLSAAEAQAIRLLAEHRSATYVSVVQDDVEVFRAAGRDAALNSDAPAAVVAALTTASDAFPGLAIIATSAEGAVRHWNAAASELYGWAPEEALGRNILDLTPADQSRTEASVIMSALAAGKPWQGEIVLRKKDGTPLRAFVVDLPLQWEADRFIVGLSVPAAERRALDRRRAEVEIRLRTALG